MLKRGGAVRTNTGNPRPRRGGGGFEHASHKNGALGATMAGLRQTKVPLLFSYSRDNDFNLHRPSLP